MTLFEVPYEATFRGIALVEADSADAAEALVNAGDFEHDDQAEWVDWGLNGSAKECE